MPSPLPGNTITMPFIQKTHLAIPSPTTGPKTAQSQNNARASGKYKSVIGQLDITWHRHTTHQTARISNMFAFSTQELITAGNLSQDSYIELYSSSQSAPNGDSTEMTIMSLVDSLQNDILVSPAQPKIDNQVLDVASEMMLASIPINNSARAGTQDSMD